MKSTTKTYRRIAAKKRRDRLNPNRKRLNKQCKCERRIRKRGDSSKCVNCGLYIPGRNIYRTKEYIDVFNATYIGVNYCQRCGDTFELQIHHINKNPQDNHPLNLIKLCMVCHCKAHKGDRVYGLMIKRLKFLQSV